LLTVSENRAKTEGSRSGHEVAPGVVKQRKTGGGHMLPQRGHRESI
jgi:hypothetical protein